MTGLTKRDLEREVENLRATENYPQAGLVTLLSTASNSGPIEAIDPDRLLYRIDGKVMQVYPSILKLAEESR